MNHVVTLAAALFCAALPLTSTLAADIPLVNSGDTWRYNKGNAPYQADWKTVADAGLGASWQSGPEGFGYGDGDDATVLSDMSTSYSTIYIRRSFTIPSPVDTNMHLILVMDWDDGFVAWLDGQEIKRDRAPGSVGVEPGVGARATSGHAASIEGGSATTYDLGAVGDRLSPGVHILALMGLNDQTNSSDLSLIADLKLREATTPPVVAHADTWRYHKGTNAPVAGWKTVSDASLGNEWPSGPGGFGYGDSDDGTVLSDMLNFYSTVYIRKTFNIASPPAANLHVLLTMDWDDGFVAYLDGVEVKRGLAPGADGVEPLHTDEATGLHEASAGSGGSAPVTYDLGLAATLLPPGDHILAIIGLNEALDSSDVSLIADLSLGVAPPPPSGSITTDTIWTAANSPYVISNSITVVSGVTLTIEPGVSVALAGGANVTIANGGRMLVQGTSNAPVLFTRSGASSWGGITINGGVGSPETKISYTRFEFNGSTAIHSSAGSLAIDHVNFSATDHQYLSLDGSSFVVSDCHFPSATGLFENVHGTSGIKTAGRGIFLRNFFGVANSVSGNYNDVLDFTGGNRPGPIVQFIDNVFIGSDDDLLDLDSTDAWIEHNIFLHVHKNGSPDSASAISGGKDNNDNSQITIIGNLIYDCDQAATAKQGNFYTLINNTIVHQTKTGGVDTDSGVVNLADDGTVEGAGFYLEGNIIYDAENLVRNLNSAIVTFNNNLMPLTWAGPGTGNSTANPMLKHVPQLSETVFTNWSEAQIMWDWFSLLPGSPGIGTGPNGRDLGGVIPIGASISGEPMGSTSQTTATLTVGVNRTGDGIPTAGWPNGSGYTHYKWRLDGGPWSAETPINTPISLSNLASGPHYVEAVGKRDSDWYQDDPIFGEDAIITRSRTWTVSLQPKIDSISLVSPSQVEIVFSAKANKGYTIEYRESLTAGTWLPLVHLDPVPTSHTVNYPDALLPGQMTRFYRLVEQ